MLSLLKDIAKRSPIIYSTVRSLQMAGGFHLEPEMAILPFVVDKGRLAVDVGASSGAYVHRLLRLGASVVAVEANPRYMAILKALYGRQKLKIIWAAASSEDGQALLKIPKEKDSYNYGLATIEEANDCGGADADSIDVPKITLDGLGLSDVGFIKIDVEGHEQEVLHGSRNMIERDRPIILIETENRHRPDAVGTVQRFMSDLGYRGFFLDEGVLNSIARFDAARDQAISEEDIPLQNNGLYRGRYINNFIFLP